MAVINPLILERAVEAVRAVAPWGSVRAAYIFGSQLTGAADEWSDIDVAAFVEGAEAWDFDRVVAAASAAQDTVGLDIEMHFFPAAHHENPPRASFAQYILRHGLRLEIDTATPQTA